MLNAGFAWDVSPTAAFEPLYDNYVRHARAAVAKIAQFIAPQIETWMKENANWTDQTGNLRQSLHAETEIMVNEIAINFDYGLFYGVFLEYGSGGKYQIISPALDHFTPIVMQMLQGVFGS